MGFSARDVVPFTQARAQLSELADEANAGAEKVIARNGERFVALIDAALAQLHDRVELTASFLEGPDAIEAFLTEADAGCAFDALLAELRATVIPHRPRFPLMGRRFLDPPLRSAEALAALPEQGAQTLREYLHGDFLLAYVPLPSRSTAS